MSVIELNGNYYALMKDSNGRSSVTQSYVKRMSSAFRTVGMQKREDDTSVNRYVNTGFPNGIGWARAKRDSGRGVGGMLDSTCWTALGPVTLGRLQETQTHVSPADHFKQAVNFNGELYGVFEEDYDTGEAAMSIYWRKFNAGTDTWDAVTYIDISTSGADEGARAFDMVVHKSLMFTVMNFGNGSAQFAYRIYTINAAESSADASGTGWPDTAGTHDYVTATVNERNNYDDDMARLLSFGNTLVVALFRDSAANDGDGLIEILSTVDSGSNWVSDVTIPSGYGPKALVDWYNLSVERSPVLVTAEGIYAIDIANNTFELIYGLDGDPATGRWAEVGNDGGLYVGFGSGQILRLAITDSNTLTVTNIGPPGDGLVAARQGHPTYMLRTPTEWLMVAYGGHASGKNASIFMIDTSVLLTDPETNKKYMPWHHMWQDSTGNLDIVAMAYSTASDGTARLHFAVEGAAASINYHIEEPFVHPEQSSTVKHQATSILRLPDDDLGDPQTTAMILQAYVDADDLSADTDDEFISLRYGTNGASDTTTTLGNFLSSALSQSFASGVGIAVRRIGINLLLDRGSTTTNTPKMHEFELQGHHVLQDKLAWDFVIDIAATVRDYSPDVTSGQSAEEVVISNLETVAQSTTLITFTSGRMTQTRVRVPNDIPPQFDLNIVDSGGKDTGYRTGFVTIRVEEGI